MQDLKQTILPGNSLSAGATVMVLVILFLQAFSFPADGLAGVRKDPNNITIKELEFKDARVKDALRIISELTGVNIVATTEAGKGSVTLFVRHLSVTDVVDGICRIAGLWYRHNEETGVFIVMTAKEYQQDIVVFRHEPTRMFQLKYLNVGIVARTIADLFGDRVELLGKANRQLGNDFKVGETFESFQEDYDEGDSEDETDTNDNNTTTTNRSDQRYGDQQRFNRSGEKDSGELTVNQLAMLQKKMAKGQESVSEGLMGQVEQRRESTIHVTVNRLHNMLFVRTADEHAMEEIAGIVAQSDQQVPEVLLEMKVLEVQLTDQFESAFDISNISGSQKSGPDDGQAVNPLNPSAATSGSSLLGMGNFGLVENSTMVFQALSGNLRLRLQLLEEDNNIKALATPMLLAANNHPARLFIGEETVLTTGFKTETVDVGGSDNTVITVPVPETETREIGNNLSILPSINADRSVVMRIVHENSTVQSGGGKIPLVVNGAVEYVEIDTVNTSTLEGTVLAQDGMTIAVGGMMRTSHTDSETKVPLLGDIPGLGFLFKDKRKVTSKTELVLLITPHVLRAPDQGEALTRKRIKALVNSPNDLELYLDEKDGTKGMDSRGKDDMSREISGLPDAGASVLDPGILQKNFIEMTTVAVNQVRTPFVLRKPQGSIRSVIIPSMGNVKVLKVAGVDTEPVAAWTNGYHYVTALKVINRNKAAVMLDMSQLNGEWRAATLERQDLSPKGEEGDSTYLYLISDKKFENTPLVRVK